MDKAAVFHATTEDLENLILVRKGGILAVKPWRSNSSASNKKKNHRYDQNFSISENAKF